MTYTDILKTPLSFSFQAKALPTKGVLAWEYNPFRNYRLTDCNKFKYNDKYYTLAEIEENLKITIGGNISQSEFKYNRTRLIDSSALSKLGKDPSDLSSNQWYNCEILSNGDLNILSVNSETWDIELYEKGLLVDFETTELDLDLEHPVQISTQESYDNSVNLIINDGKNIPRLINSRFSPIGKNQYQIVDRKGDNDTNIYDLGDLFDIDTSLYKRTIKIPKLEFKGVYPGGNLSVGNYHFYFKYSDADGNETDWIAESGLVSVFLGTTPTSIDSGFSKLNSKKLVKFKLTNIDSAYNYVKVYYSKETSGFNLESETTYHKIEHKYIVDKNNTCNITISGFTKDLDASADDINMQYSLVSSAETQAICKNMLFLGNIKKPDIPYLELTDLSLRFLPKRNIIDYDIDIDSLYYISTDLQGYYDSNYIYNYTGYWNDEIYRLGIVYILPDNSLSPVFNIRGGYNLDENPDYTETEFYEKEGSSDRHYISISEDDYSIIESKKGKVKIENAKGVITLATATDKTKHLVYGISILMGKDEEEKDNILTYLKKYTKGFFFVRLKRLPTTLCLAISIATDKHNYLPTIPIGKSSNLFVSQLTGVAYTQQDDTRLSILDVLTKNYKANIDSYTGTTKYVKASSANKNLASSLNKSTTYFAEESFLNSSERYITNNFFERIRPVEKSKVKINAALCPECELDLNFYGNLFTGDDFVLKQSDMLPKETYLSWTEDEPRNFYVNGYESIKLNRINDEYSTKVLLIPDSSKMMAIGNDNYKGIAGNAIDAWRFEYIAKDNKKTKATNFIRGAWGPYLGLSGATKNNVLTQYDIKIPGYNKSKMNEYFTIRYSDNSSFYPISDRIAIDDWNDSSVFYRGDCFICQFTHRMNRNFQDPSAPTNDDIVDPKCWANNYKVNDGVIDKSKFSKINTGDINAVRIGHWVTFTVRSTKNLCIRALDNTHSDELSLIGHGRGFYPRFKQNLDGSYKTPESALFNKGFLKEMGSKYYFEAADVPAIKNEFSNRILYSNPSSNDSYANNLRVFELNHFKDYSKEFGLIIKLVESNGKLVCVFEHGIGVIPVNEKALLTNAEGDDVYVGTAKVISEPTIISDKYGSLWKESVIKTPNYIYGVDTVAKKIWRIGTDSTNPQTISDFHIQQFLNQNITLGERELTPVVGIRNVKTHYNAYKNDVMFTFYDNLHGFEEKVWNICWNELTQVWTTLYSWVPSYSENIFNLFFSFDRNTSKYIAKLGISNSNSSFADGITLTQNIIDDSSDDYKNVNDSNWYRVGLLKISNRDLPEKYNIKYTLEHDPFGNYKYFEIGDGTDTILDEDGNPIAIETSNTDNTVTETVNTVDGIPYGIYQTSPLPEDYNYPVILLNVTADVVSSTDNETSLLNSTLVTEQYFANTIAICLNSVYENGNIKTYDSTKPSLMSSFWKHGQAGLLDIADKIKPCYWYGKQHPFEFEYCVSEYPEVLKIFDNLQIISNSAEPDSFHYWIQGDSLEFAEDKKNMYIRQEATKELYQYNGSDILYNEDWKDIEKELTNNYTQSIQNPKSTLLPQIYESRQDTVNEIEDFYKKITTPNKNYDELSGTEVTHDSVTDEYGLWVHADGINIDEGEGNRLRGNMQYKNDTWRVQVNPINFVLKNEYVKNSDGSYSIDSNGNLQNSTWTNNKVPITIANVPIPKNVNPEEIEIPSDLLDRTIDSDSWGSLPLIQVYDKTTNSYKYTYGGIDDASTRQLTKVRDKYIKIRVRYSGEKLAIIRKIITVYSTTAS